MKLSKESLKSFNQDIISILSPKRLEGYQGSVERHYKNLNLALEVGRRIANLEIYLRNKMDFCLRKLVGEKWIKSERSLRHIEQKGHIPLLELDSNQILSTLMLGEIIKLITEYEIEGYMFELQAMDFKKYHWSNRNFFFLDGNKFSFSNISKNTIVLNNLRSIRNRAFHWENLLKTREVNGKVYPRITTSYPQNQNKNNQTKIGIAPEMILEFLNDLIENIDNEEMRKYLYKG